MATTAIAANSSAASLPGPIVDWIQRSNPARLDALRPRLSKTKFNGHGSSRFATPSPTTAIARDATRLVPEMKGLKVFAWNELLEQMEPQTGTKGG
jgi:hypothetical protein